MGDRQVLAGDIVRHFEGYLPLIRGLVHLLGQTPPAGLKAALDLLFKLTGAETDVYEEIYHIKQNPGKPSKEEITQLFTRFYRATERLAEVVDGLPV
jgi:hypothetical protein